MSGIAGLSSREDNRMERKAYLVANPMTPCKAVVIDPEVCGGCNNCVEVCRTDVMVPNPEKVHRGALN